MSALAEIGVVAIGRNEGPRLTDCLDSIPSGIGIVVYVDSGSDDGSPESARNRGFEVVELDSSLPFTAARARNAGVERIRQLRPDIEYVQCIDGDCRIDADWPDLAQTALRADPGLGAVCGGRQEIAPERSVYNSLCQLEWNQAQPGPIRAFGGDVMLRLQAFAQVGGYDPGVIAAEDDELSVRLRKAGWKIERLDAAMTHHDADITRLSQWWQRTKRCGYAYAQVASIHGGPPERYFARERTRVWVWGLAVPALAVAAAWPTRGLSLLLFALYPVRAVRIALRSLGDGVARRVSWAWGVSCALSPVAQIVGMVQFLADSLRGKTAVIIEYKQ